MSLEEGSTPLLLAERLSERVGAEVWLKIEGANPTGSFKDRGMTCAVSDAVRDGAEAVICASTGNTAASLAAYAARAGLQRRGDRPRGQDRHRQARPGADARRPRDRAARQLRRGAEARARAHAAPPDRAGQLRQPVPAGGAEDGGVRGAGRDRGDRRAVHPGGQRGQRHRVLEGLPGDGGVAAHARLPGRGRRAAGARRAGGAAGDGRQRDPDRQPRALGGGDGGVHGLARPRGRGERRPDPRRLPLPGRRRGRVLRARLGGERGRAAGARRGRRRRRSSACSPATA